MKLETTLFTDEKGNDSYAILIHNNFKTEKEAKKYIKDLTIKDIKIIDIAQKVDIKLVQQEKDKVKKAIRNIIKKEDEAVNSPSRGCDFFWYRRLRRELKRLE